MNKSKLKIYAPLARKDFIAAVTARANLLGFSEVRGQFEVAPGERKGDIAIMPAGNGRLRFKSSATG